nr:methyltransferase domain-containing protein [uncultured Friedmanniella sp.]
MAEIRRRRSVSATFLLDLLASQLRGLDPTGAPLEVVDLGGGTGGVATALAGHGHRVTVIDPSPDALASLERRTAEAGLEGRIRARQGDAADLIDVVGERSVDVVVCHRVLEVVESPADALSAVAAVLRPAGALSLLASQRKAAVLGHALAGHIALARRAWEDHRRFDYDGLVALLADAGFTVQSSHGIGALADHVAESVLDAEPGAFAALTALEAEISEDPAFRALAPQVHLFARVGLSTPAAVD